MTAVGTTMIAIASTASLITLGILLYQLWEHHTEAKRKRVLDSFQERKKLADEYSKLVGYPTQALANNALIEVQRVGATLVDTEYLTPKEVQDRITQMKASNYDIMEAANEMLRERIDSLTKQIEVLKGAPEPDQLVTIGDVQHYGNVVRQHSEPVLTVSPSKKRRKKK